MEKKRREQDNVGLMYSLTRIVDGASFSLDRDVGKCQPTVLLVTGQAVFCAEPDRM